MADMNLSEALSFARTLGAKVQWIADIEKMLMAAASAQQAEQEALKRLDAAHAEMKKYQEYLDDLKKAQKAAVAEYEKKIEEVKERHVETIRRLDEELEARKALLTKDWEIAERGWREASEAAEREAAVRQARLDELSGKVAALQTTYDELRGKLASL